MRVCTTGGGPSLLQDHARRVDGPRVAVPARGAAVQVCAGWVGTVEHCLAGATIRQFCTKVAASSEGSGSARGPVPFATLRGMPKSCRPQTVCSRCCGSLSAHTTSTRMHLCPSIAIACAAQGRRWAPSLPLFRRACMLRRLRTALVPPLASLLLSPSPALVVVAAGTLPRALSHLQRPATDPRPASPPFRTFATMATEYVLPEQWSEDLKDENGAAMSKRRAALWGGRWGRGWPDCMHVVGRVVFKAGASRWRG